MLDIGNVSLQQAHYARHDGEDANNEDFNRSMGGVHLLVVRTYVSLWPEGVNDQRSSKGSMRHGPSYFPPIRTWPVW